MIVKLLVSLSRTSGSFSPLSRIVCPSEPTTFTCTVTDDGMDTTIWQGSSSVFDCLNNVIVLIHIELNDTNDCGAASAQLKPPVGNNYISVLTIVPTLEMDGAVIQCAFGSLANIIGEGTLNIISKLCIEVTITSALLPLHIVCHT